MYEKFSLVKYNVYYLINGKYFNSLILYIYCDDNIVTRRSYIFLCNFDISILYNKHSILNLDKENT